MSRHHSHRLTRIRLRRLFVQGTCPAARRRIIADAAGCPECRDLMRRYYRSEGALSGLEPVAAPAALDRMAEAIFDTVLPAAKPKQHWYLKLKYWAAFATLTTAIVLFWIVGVGIKDRAHRISLTDIGPHHIEELTPRGSYADSSDFGIRVFSISRTSRNVSENPRLTLNDIMTFSYTRAAPGRGYLALFGIQSGGKPIWYYPDYGDQESVEVQGNRIDEPLGDGFDLRPHHQEGALLIVALFSEAPIATSSIETIVAEQNKKGMRLDAMARYSWHKLHPSITTHAVVLELEGQDESSIP